MIHEQPTSAERKMSDDPAERAVAEALAAGKRLERLARAIERTEAARIEAVRRLRELGWSHLRVATALGISRARAADLAAGRSLSNRVTAVRKRTVK